MQGKILLAFLILSSKETKAVSFHPSKESVPDTRAKEAQLIISLKFHHGHTLSEIPLEAAVNAMVKVWKSCNAQNDAAQEQGQLLKQPPEQTSPAPTKTIYL